MFTILLVDDDYDEFDLLQSACQNINANITVTLAGSCDEALRELKIQCPDIIFMDINLGGKSGFECLKSIRNTVHVAYVPILMYSTSKNQSTINEAYLNDANLYIVKPYTLEGIEDMIKKIVAMDWKNYSKTTPADFVLS
ncbi:MAG TPA: response regulator [Chitinophagaceae bacterium]|jgi:CheY-like chemotaxis protein|nr:response regulator [Chitinophagaceae bacterium]